jgi:hypothetical protein
MFLTVEMKRTSRSAPVQGCSYEIEVENTTTVVHDVVIHSKVIDGTPSGLGQNSNNIQLSFTDLLDSPVRRKALIAWSSSKPSVVRAHAFKLSRKCDVDSSWTDDIVDPIIETMAER